MAFTPKVLQRSGWRYQAEYLISTHAAFGTAAITMAEQTRRRSLFQRTDDYSDILEAEFGEATEKPSAEETKAQAAEVLEPPQPGVTAAEAADAAKPEEQIAEAADIFEPQAAPTPAMDAPEPEAAAAPAADASKPETPVADTAEGSAVEAEASEAAKDSAEAIAQPAGVQQQLVQIAIFEDVQSSRIETLIAESERTDRKAIRLQEQLDATREELALKENESASLQASLDLFAAENKRLSQLVAEKDVEAEAMRAQLEQMKSTLLWTEDERVKSLLAGDDTKAQHRAELSRLEARIEAETARAAAADKALADLKRRMLTPSEYNAFQKLIVDTTLARNAAARRLDILEMSLQKKEQQVQALQDARSKLIDGTNSLLETFSARDAALARAELAIKFLVKRISQLEAEAKTKAAPARKDAARPAALVPQRPQAAANGRSHP